MQKLPHIKNRHLHPLFSAIGRCKNCRAFFRTQKYPEKFCRLRNKCLLSHKTSDDMMKPGSNMQLSKKSLAEELAGRLQEQFMSGKFEVGEKLPPEPGIDADFRGRPLNRARSGQNPVQHGFPEGTAGCRDICRTPHAAGRTDGAAPRTRRPARSGRGAENTGSRDCRKKPPNGERHTTPQSSKSTSRNGERPRLPGHCRPVSKPTSTSTSPWPRPRTTKSCASCIARRPPI